MFAERSFEERLWCFLKKYTKSHFSFPVIVFWQHCKELVTCHKIIIFKGIIIYSHYIVSILTLIILLNLRMFNIFSVVNLFCVLLDHWANRICICYTINAKGIYTFTLLCILWNIAQVSKILIPFLSKNILFEYCFFNIKGNTLCARSSANIKWIKIIKIIISK